MPENLCIQILETNYDIAQPERVLKSYASLQLQCIPLVDQLIEIGLSDLRPKALPALFEALLAGSDLGFKSEDLANLLDSQAILTLRDSYLQYWQGYASHDELVHGFAIADALMAFVWALGLKRIQSCPGVEHFEYSSYVDKVMHHYYANFPKPH